MGKIKELLNKHYYPPNVSEQLGESYCFVCGTPFNKEKWEKHNTKAHSQIISTIVTSLEEKRTIYRYGSISYWVVDDCIARIKTL